VGDSIEADVAGALAAGVRPVLVARDGGPSPRGVVTVASLAELPSVLTSFAE
jgi:FMN phosphatase YigB (HAD superfamily)